MTVRPAQVPLGAVPAPPRVLSLAGGDALKPVWVNEVGGLTFEATAGTTRRFIKWAPLGRGLDLAAEAERLRWAVDFAPVPVVLDAGRDDDAEWMVTAGLPGRSAVDDYWLNRPELAAASCGRALRAFHDLLDPALCPFDWSVEARVARSPKSPSGFGDPPPIDRLVVCHGDPCVPNTLLLDDGTWSAMVDVDALGVADRWADIAVATMSLGWNYGPGWDEQFLQAYGVDPDPVRTAFYRELWNAT